MDDHTISELLRARALLAKAKRNPGPEDVPPTEPLEVEDDVEPLGGHPSVPKD